MPLSDLWAPAPCTNSDDDNDNDNVRADAAESQALRRRARTFKARTALAVSKERKRMQQEIDDHFPDPELGPQTVFQQQFLSSPTVQWDPCESSTGIYHKFDEVDSRRRAVYLYFKSFAKAVRCFFHGERTKPAIDHLISVNTNDDTNMKLASGRRGSSEVRSVMNNIQEHIAVTRTKPTEMDSLMTSKTCWFALHQPLVALDKADTSGLFRAFISWVLGFAGYVGWRLRAWGIPHDLLKHVKHHTFIFNGDALRVNDAMFKTFAQCVQEQSGHVTKTTVLQIHCGIHQLALTRKTLVLGFTSYWSTLVRLGHLFESHSFRQRFHAAMSRVVHENFDFIEVSELPEQVVEWNQQKIMKLRLYMDVGHMGLGQSSRERRNHARISTRHKALVKHMQKDNGDPCSERFTHWCTGDACCPGGHHEALSSMITSYLDMFSSTCVPLLYRWKHAAAANNFIRDGVFWHNVLPRTLQVMPSLKCFLLRLDPNNDCW